ncbi:ABC transporter ATP-binding protein [Microbacterium sp. p3-SID338]|uniref:ABC transporter ATP-binding protein n=1 Tax=unclassified Microbacterium TaxID=2609290 RepID=UPI000C80AC13|nr:MULTISPECIES: ABC transporter ATP-binding protein [unclassified Microbacterium]MCT1396915.1 ABC transporter ATP-binding protein [Microbacterium sp. p3-SID338]PMC05121.1 glutathione ABC transporter ATP-binding protein [Microbacterium sp. UMB0228]
MSDALLSISDLRVTFRTEDGAVEAVKGIDLDVRSGEVLALVGESGSGKSVTAMAVMKLLPRTAQVTGSIRLDGRELLPLPESDMNAVRGAEISMVFQEPMTALNPSMRIGDQITEAILNHNEIPRSDAWERAVELLQRVGIPEPERRVKSYPHELSGGQRQRVVIAIALACEPQLIIADEPTTALDVTVQAEILDLIRRLAAESGTAFLLVTHNMGVVADIADRVAVMFRGTMVEVGDTRAVLTAPREDYTKKLLSAVPSLPDVATAVPREPEPVAPDPVLALDRASVTYRRGGRSFLALNGVSLRIAPGEIVGLVGESGSGKSTLGRAALGLLPLSGGEMTLFGQTVGRGGVSGRRERELRARVGAIFQDPGSSLDPRMTVGEAIAEPLLVQRRRFPTTASQRRNRVAELLDAVELPTSYAGRYPHELSGGQRQRIGLARAIALEPELIIADEPTSALDVSVQAAVLEVLRTLQEKMHFACLFISHDLAVVHEISDRVAVMLKGEIVETGSADDVLLAPQHPYSRRLLASVPVPDPDKQAVRREARAAARVATP